MTPYRFDHDDPACYENDPAQHVKDTCTVWVLHVPVDCDPTVAHGQSAYGKAWSVRSEMTPDGVLTAAQILRSKGYALTGEYLAHCWTDWAEDPRPGDGGIALYFRAQNESDATEAGRALARLLGLDALRSHVITTSADWAEMLPDDLLDVAEAVGVTPSPAP